jgi:8-oxo-dGTP diphosphatase
VPPGDRTIAGQRDPRDSTVSSLPRPRHCAGCGRPDPWEEEGEGRLRCRACGFVVWSNPVPVAIAVQPVMGGILLVRRAAGPGQGLWALPGGYVNAHEDPKDAAVRELREETAVEAQNPELIAVVGGLSDNTMLIAYRMDPLPAMPETAASAEVLEVRVFRLDELPLLAFSAHESLLGVAFPDP